MYNRIVIFYLFGVIRFISHCALIIIPVIIIGLTGYWVVMGCLRALLLSILLGCCCSLRLDDCPPCEQISCAHPAPTGNCSQLFDECGCCPHCASEQGEKCGGWGNAGGECAPGLSCNYRVGSILGEEKTGICETGKRAARAYRKSSSYTCIHALERSAPRGWVVGMARNEVNEGFRRE